MSNYHYNWYLKTGLATSYILLLPCLNFFIFIQTEYVCITFCTAIYITQVYQRFWTHPFTNADKRTIHGVIYLIASTRTWFSLITGGRTYGGRQSLWNFSYWPFVGTVGKSIISIDSKLQMAPWIPTGTLLARLFT